MSETKPSIPSDLLDKVGGGGCTVADAITIVGQLTDAYESLIDFTSYVIGRVNGDPPVQP